MSIQTEIYGFLSTDAGVIAIIPDVFEGTIPDDFQGDAIVFNADIESSISTLDAPSLADIYTLEVRCVVKDSDTLDLIKPVIIPALIGFESSNVIDIQFRSAGYDFDEVYDDHILVTNFSVYYSN
jgi:hypothetical protein